MTGPRRCALLVAACLVASGARAQDEPPPPAARTLHSWAEAAALLRRFDPDQAAAIETLEQAEAAADQALAGLWPRLQLAAAGEDRPAASLLDPASGRLRTSWAARATWTVSGALELSVPLVAPSRWARIRTADRETEAAERALRSAQHRAHVALAATLIATVTAERLGEVAREGARAAASRLQLVRQRRDLGSATALDVQRFETDTLAARALVVSAHDAIWRARAALATALGSRVPVAVAPGLTVDRMLQDALAACRPLARPEQRPEVAAAVSGAVAATEAVRETRAAFWPTASLTTRYEVARTSASAGTLTSEHATTQVWSVLGVLQWTLFDGGERAALSRGALAAGQRAHAQVEVARARAALEVERARRELESAEAAHAIASEARASARETDRLTRLELQLGRGSAFEAVDAAARLRRSELELTLREYALVQARFGSLIVLAECS